jgi:isopentenyl-diphosphate delta-isomerase
MTTTWDGNAMTQTDMMEKDTVLVLDQKDNVIGSASKRTSHEFTTDQARGILHRAFSVFLFDESTGELLLQQRASTKITFPNVRRKMDARRLSARILSTEEEGAKIQWLKHECY